MRWRWETLPRVPRRARRHAASASTSGAYVAHAPLRVFAMGERGATDARRRATTSSRDARGRRRRGDRGRRARRLDRPHDDAPHARPATRSRARSPTAASSRALAAPLAPARRRRLPARALRRRGRGGRRASRATCRSWSALARETRPAGEHRARRRPGSYPDVWRDSLARIEAAARRRASTSCPQVAPRSIGLLLGFGRLLSPLLLFPAAGDLLEQPRRRAAASRCATRRCGAGSSRASTRRARSWPAWRRSTRVFPLDRRAASVAYETTPARSVAGLAAARGVLAGRGDPRLAPRVRPPRALPGRALQLRPRRGAARCSRIRSAVPGPRRRGRAHEPDLRRRRADVHARVLGAPPPRADARDARCASSPSTPAAAVGHRRARPRPRRLAIADLNVIDLERLDLGLPEVRHDLPGGADEPLAARARATSRRW